jgi:hypothetical protein
MIVDAFSRKVALLVILRGEIIGFNRSKELYKHDKDLGELWEKVRTFLLVTLIFIMVLISFSFFILFVREIDLTFA